jgi:hypothetical protein
LVAKVEDIRTKLKGGNTLVASPWKVLETLACGTSVMVREGMFTWQFVNKIGFGITAISGTSEEIFQKLPGP